MIHHGTDVPKAIADGVSKEVAERVPKENDDAERMADEVMKGYPRG